MKKRNVIARLAKALLQRIDSLDFLINTAAILVMPTVMFSFWCFSERNEYADLRASGQKLNLNMHNLLSAYRRKPDDPLRDPHIRLARIGFLYWIAIPVGFSTVLAIGVVSQLVQSGLS
jgi:hypothetical protein